MQTMLCKPRIDRRGFENASTKCGLSRLDSLCACSSVLTETRVSIVPEANACENREMGGYGMTAGGCKAVVGRFVFLRLCIVRPHYAS